MDREHVGNSIYCLKYHFSRLTEAWGFLDHKIKSIPRDRFLILMYHRILPDRLVDETIQAGMYVLPETFERHLCFLSARFEMASLPELDRLAGTVSKRPRCLITFDDGWIDFYEYAFPVLQKYHIPATVFLPTDFTGTGNAFWTDRLAILLQKLDRDGSGKQSIRTRGLDPLLDTILGFQGDLASRIEYSIRHLKQQPAARNEHVLHALDQMVGDKQKGDRVFLTWNQVRELRQTGLVDFGSHTARHSILTELGEEDVRTELGDSRKKLIQEQAVAHGAIPFCYPNGAYSEKIKEMVREEGYSSACTTRSGFNLPGTDRYALKRVGMHQDMTAHEGLLGCKLLGLV